MCFVEFLLVRFGKLLYKTIKKTLLCKLLSDNSLTVNSNSESFHISYCYSRSFLSSICRICQAFQIWINCVENKWEGNRVPLGERKLYCILTKEPQNFYVCYVFHILCDMGLPCSKLNNSDLIKDRNKIFAVSERYLNIL